MPERSMWTRNLLSRSKHYRSGLSETSLALKTASTLFVRRFGRSVEGDDVIALNRDFLVQLWVADRKMRSSKTTRKRLVDSHPSFLRQFGKRHSRVLSGDAKHSVPESPALDQRSPSQLVKDFLKSKPACVDPKKHLLVRSNLLITRDIEWANLALGFEQENRYVILDMWCPQAPVGYIREKSNIIARQLLRSRRPFVAFVIDENGDELFKICRPFWWITSSIYTEIDGEEVGVVHRRWHLWRRIYDLYLGNKQFATVENPGLWNWTFTLKDIDGNVLAEIDRNWRGFGFEILTDAGQYAIRFGGDGVCQTGSDGIKELEVVRPLSIPERAIALALAVSLDNDYFSRHGGW